MLIEGNEEGKMGREKQINIFNLKDIVISSTLTASERLEALAKLKK